MRPVRIEGYTRVMGKDQPEYLPLCIRDEPYVLATAEGDQVVNSMIAAFEPTPQQIRQLNEGGKIHLRILGTGWPPVGLWVEPSK